MLNRTRLASALLALSGVVACGGTAKVEPGAAGAGSMAQGGTPASAGAPPLTAGSGNSNGVGGSSGASGSMASAGASGDAGAPGTCVVGGVVHAIGERFACDCNTCWCEPDGSISGTQIACNECQYAGQSYRVGEKFPDRDGCNQCECMSSGASCTEKYCGCHPDQEWYRHYTATSAASCALIDYVCAEHTVAFSNDCGCGCEQGLSCPEYIDCIPGSTTCASMKALCPFSIPAL